MILWVIDIEQKEIESGKNAGNPYWTIHYKNDKDHEGSKSIFDKGMIETFRQSEEQGLAVDAKMEKKGDYWNIVGAVLVSEELKDKPKTTPDMKPIEESAGGKVAQTRDEKIRENMEWKEKQITENMWWGHLERWLQLKENDEKKDPFWLQLRSIYFAKMFKELPLKVEKKED